MFFRFKFLSNYAYSFSSDILNPILAAWVLHSVDSEDKYAKTVSFIKFDFEYNNIFIFYPSIWSVFKTGLKI